MPSTGIRRKRYADSPPHGSSVGRMNPALTGASRIGWSVGMRDKKGRHLTAFDRHEIWLGIREGKSARKIAEGLGCSPSTVTRELKAGTMTRVTPWGRGLRRECCYDYRYAQAEAERRGSKKGRQLKIGSDHETARALERYIVEEGHSPTRPWRRRAPTGSSARGYAPTRSTATSGKGSSTSTNPASCTASGRAGRRSPSSRTARRRRSGSAASRSR